MSKVLTLCAALLLVLASPGCSPQVICNIETVILPDYTCKRVLRFDATPHPNYPNQRPRLGEYFQFPPAELYETYLAQPEKAIFAGAFESYDRIPPDLKRLTPGSDRVAGNTFSFRVMDLVLVVLADFDETITDIIKSREDGQAALGELIRLVVPEVMSVLNARYGSKYDLSQLDHWLNADLVAKVQRIYGLAWDLHSAKRSGVTSPSEFIELYMLLKREAQREGLELADLGTPDLYQENIRRLKEFGAKKALELCPPRQPGAATLPPDLFSGSVGEELLGAVQKAVIARHGSINEYLRKIAALVPRSFGAYLTGTVAPMYMLPDTRYFCRLRFPGMVLQTNGMRDVSGDLLWNFTDSDLAFTGQSMWARTLYVREQLVSGLGLQGFPSSVADVDRLFSLSVAQNGQPRDAMLTALQQSALGRSLAPLEALAANPSSPDAAAARGVLELLQHFRQPETGSVTGQQPVAPARPQPAQLQQQPHPAAAPQPRQPDNAWSIAPPTLPPPKP